MANGRDRLGARERLDELMLNPDPPLSGRSLSLS